MEITVKAQYGPSSLIKNSGSEIKPYILITALMTVYSLFIFRNNGNAGIAQLTMMNVYPCISAQAVHMKCRNTLILKKKFKQTYCSFSRSELFGTFLLL